MKILSYNILADSYIKSDWYPNIPSDILDWRSRKQRLCEQLVKSKSDILCLQEVEGTAYNELFEVMKGEGYQGLYARKGFGRLDGCATFFKKNAFDFQGAKTIFYNDHGENGLASGHVALIVKLDNLNIVNTHIRWNLPEKSPEEHRGYRQVNELVESHLSDDKKWIICGDFNSEIHTPVMQLLLQAGFVDTYGNHPQPTMNKEGLVRIDYIFHSKELEAKPEQIFSLTEKTLLPSKEHPSDHLAIAATFSAI